MYPRDKKTYAAYEASVKEFHKREKIMFITTEEEQYVSSHGCDCCGSPEQQILIKAIALVGNNKGDCKNVDFEVCEDCQYYLEYGRLPDSVMEEIEN